MLYISRVDAVRERMNGAFFQNLPEQVGYAKSYAELRRNLDSYSWVREESEVAQHKRRGGSGIARSHYRCILSFEREARTHDIERMTREWLAQTLPQSSVAAFVHRNTERVHVHLWIDARGINGKKLDFSPKEWRAIGAKWDRIYTREMIREDRLREKLGLQEEIGREQARNERGDIYANDGAKAIQIQRSETKTRESAAYACSLHRSEAVQETRKLREELARLVAERTLEREGMGRER